MSEKNIIDNKDGNQILKTIFALDSSQNNKLLPILEDFSKIKDIISFLKNNENNIHEKIEIIKTLYNLFTKNFSLLILFMKKTEIKTINFYEPLMDLYFSEEISPDDKDIIERMIKIINSKISTSKIPIYYLCQKLSYYFNNINEEVKLDLLNEKKMLSYLNLFKIFYLGENNEKNELVENEIINKEIKNYIYFNGKGSRIKLNLNNNSINNNTNYPTIKYGLSFIMWIYIDVYLIKEHKALDKESEICLVTINFNGKEIKLILKDIYTFQLYLTDSKPKTIQNNLIKVNDWNNIIFSLYEMNSNNLPIKIFINSVALNNSIIMPKKFKDFTRISSINLFENFIGKVSSCMMITKGIDNKEVNYFNDKIKYGFYKNKILFNFILANEKNYFANCKNYKYYEKCNANDISSLYDLHLSKQNIKNLLAVFCPFAYNKDKNQIDDIFGNFVGTLGNNDCVNNFVNNTEKIRRVGGIKNLLPIIELMYSTISNSKINNFKYIDNTILTYNTFYEYLNLIKNIIIDHNQNLVDAINSRFFTSLSIFLQQLPKEFFDDKILEILIEIGKETIKYGDTINIRIENYINMILLNEKIIINYNVKIRMILWNILYCFFTSDDTLIKDLFNIKKISFLLRFFDDQRYSKYCCKKHIQILDYVDNLPILEPDMIERTQDLFHIIQIYINKYSNEEESKYLFKLLSFDISPCLQQRIIEVYLNFFSDEKIDFKKKVECFDFIIKNNFLELLEYVYSISLFDIKLKILSIFKIFFGNNDFSKKLKKHLNDDEKTMNNFYIFISEYLLPEQIYVKIQKNQIISNEKIYSDNGMVPINYFFEKKLYEKKTSDIFSFLLEWALYPSNPNTGKQKPKYFYLHVFIIDFLISFASKCPFNYIDLLIITLSSYFKDQSILNREILILNKNLYPWLIETIFLFHNSEIHYNKYKNDDIISIKKNSLILFEDFFAHRRPHEEFNNQIYYIIRYSTHLKMIYGNVDNKKIQEVTRITRLLLEIIMRISSIHMNHRAKYCFEFMIYHKNAHNFTRLKKQLSNNNIKLSFNDIPRQSTTANLLSKINDLRIYSNLIFEDDEENIKDKINDDFNKYNINTSNNSFNLNEPDPEEKVNEKNESYSISNNFNIIPDYIYQGLHLNDNEKYNKEKTLKSYWKDFALYDGIIDYYSSNIWGTEVLGKKVGIELENNNKKLYLKLINEYGENKLNKNILFKEILKCLTIKSSSQTKIYVNILHINVILLSIALVLTKDLDENIFWEGKFIQFCLFCVLVSINISSNEEYFNLVQDNIYNTLGFAFLFMRKWSKNEYNKITENLIIPILEKNKKSKIFNLKNESNNAIFRLFELRHKNTIDNHNNIFNESNDDIYEDKNENEKNNNNINNNIFKIVFKGESNEILKQIFKDELNKIKEERKEQIIFKSNYKNEYDKQIFSGNVFTEEKMRIDQTVEKVLNSYENDINIYSSEKYIEDKNRRLKYKKIKAKLFSWNGFWSDKYLFLEHPELIKLKIKNHYTKEMTRPLLVSILDFDYYMPPFKTFEKNKLFNKDNYNYKINLDIDDILSEKIKEEDNNNQNINIIIDEENDEAKVTKNKYGFNFVECSYKYTYNNIWDIYLNYSKKKEIYRKLIVSGKQLETKKINKNKKDEISFKCCIVKITHHITGYISNKSSYILFTCSPFSIQDFENDLTFDNELGCCFGSIFIHKKSDKDKLYTIIRYSDIKYIFIRRYFYMETSLEIYTEKNKSYLFNFKSNKDLIQFLKSLLERWNGIKIKSESKKVIGYEKSGLDFKKNYVTVQKKMEKWMNNNISTLEYLMWLNIYSGRSFNDLTQYPVFPWILTSYSEDKKEEIKFRNLSIPIGMIEMDEKSKKRRENFIEVYETLKADLKDMFPDFNYQDYLKKGDEYLESYKIKKMKREKENQEEGNMIELNQIPYFFGSHYSNPTYVSHYLIRTFPFTFIGIEIQGNKFDDPDRIFSSIPKTFESATTLKDDVRELIPEFYYLPESFLNDNNIDFTQNKVNSENQLILINDVKLPFWSNNNSVNFVIELRRYLESNNINNNINKWIDIIFGSSQRGEKAEDNHNIFQAQTYDKIIKIDTISDNDTRNSLMRQNEMGVTPTQLFENETKGKIKHNSNKVITLDEGKNLIIKFINSTKFSTLKNKYYENYKYSNDPKYKEENLDFSYLKISKIISIENLLLKIFTNKGHFYEIKIEDEDSNDNNFVKITENSYYKYQNNSNNYACSYRMSDIKTPIVVYNNTQSLIEGGFWDGRLEINNFNLEKTNDMSLQIQTIFNPDFSPITTIEYSMREKIFLCGSLHGILYIYKINNYKIEYQKGLYLFDDEITSISINDNLNMFSVSSRDGYINLYILPTIDLVRTIYLNKKNQDNNSKNIFANKIFLSNYPLPCIVSYINSQKIFKSYTINGKLIGEVIENNKITNLKSPIVYTNNNFQDILIYGTDDGFIKILKFPEMILINSILIFPNKEINEICLSNDKRYCYVWSEDNIIAYVKTCKS